MDIEDILTFVEVAEAGGISSAARRLGISKSIVSRRLLRLEGELGALLVARTTRGAALTEAGVIFREHAGRIGAEIEAAKEMIRPAGDLRGRLRVAMPLTFGPTHFAPVLADMARRHPELHVHSVYSDRFVDLIADGFDCAVRVGFLPDSELLARRVGPIYGALVASPDYVRQHGSPGKPDEIASHQALMQGTETWQFVDGERIVTVNPKGRFKAESATALAAAAAAAAGLGIAWLPNCMIYDYLATGALIPIMTKHPPPAAAAYVVRSPGRRPERKVEVMTDLMTDLFEQDPRFR